jgi:hypothetical protein
MTPGGVGRGIRTRDPLLEPDYCLAEGATDGQARVGADPNGGGDELRVACAEEETSHPLGRQVAGLDDGAAHVD